MVLALAWAPSASATTDEESPYRVLDQLVRVLHRVELDYVEPVDHERLLTGAIKGLVAELDPHSSYLPAADYEIFQADTEGRFGGIGVEVDFGVDFVTVMAAIEDSPAFRAGIRPGDLIVAIDDTSVRGQSPEELVRRMRGKPGSKVNVTLRRPAEERVLTITLTREVIKVTSIVKKRLVGDIAYLRIKQFQTGTHTELVAAIGAVRKDGPIAGVLLDLRNNPGGLVNEASAVVDEFIASGVIYTTRHRERIVDEVHASRYGALQRGPVVVLVNEYSASAAELVAGALQDHHRAVVVGARTFGKGSVQTIIDLPDGDGLRLTTMRYYTPSGRAIQAQGVEPTLLVEGASTQDAAPPAVRERDLANHLPAVGPPGSGPEPQSADPKAPPAAVETHLGVAVSRQIPDDPTGGPDTALSIGYQVLTGVLQTSQ